MAARAGLASSVVKWLAYQVAVPAMLATSLLVGTSLAQDAPAAASTEPGPAVTSQQPKLWKNEWPTFQWWEGAGTIAAAAGTAALFVLEPPHDARWKGGIGFDEAIRKGVRLKSESGREKVASIGDIPYFAAPLLPLIVDPLIVAWAVHDDSKAALNMELMALEAFAYTGFMSFVSTRLSVRERPDSRQCLQDNVGDPSVCGETDTEAFWSGHTSMVAASAGLVCANHVYMPLWGHPLADAGACALATTGAALTAVSRLMADRHYATDVLVGFGVGFGFGYAVPTLFHYSRKKTPVVLSIQPGACAGGCLTLSRAW